MPAAQVIDGRSRFDITVRYPRELRDDPDKLKNNVLVMSPTGAQVPLRDVADVVLVRGPDMLKSEDGKLIVNIFIDTDRPIGAWVADANNAVADVKLPSGARLQCTG